MNSPLRFISTRGRSPAVDFIEALNAGLAPDGGLYVPEYFPQVRVPELSKLSLTLPEVGRTLLHPFVAGTVLESKLEGICERAFSFPTPLKSLWPWLNETSVLELFHGPTAAFKDVGARFLAETLTVLPPQMQRRTILVATSGDTGGAVAAAFDGKPDVEAVILYPRGKISPRQEKQLTCWSGNIRALSVRGDFDDCQRLVKAALVDPELRAKKNFTSANSINIGRILPQAAYYAMAGLEYDRQTGQTPGFIIPSGNIGNCVGALWAKKMGFPIGPIVLAFNANRAVPEFLKTGQWKPHATVATLANAMDVGDPSNLERVRHLFPKFRALKAKIQALSVTDEEIRQTIREAAKEGETSLCPHTATAAFARKTLQKNPEESTGTQWILVATAHPAKFETIVEPLIGASLPVPPSVAAILSKPSRFEEMETSFEAFKAVL